MFWLALRSGYDSDSANSRPRAPPSCASAWFRSFTAVGLLGSAATFCSAANALLRALMTASSVSRSWPMYPLTASTRFGIRSYRRLSWTSIWANAFWNWFRATTRPLYTPTSHRASKSTTPGTTSRVMTRGLIGSDLRREGDWSGPLDDDDNKACLMGLCRCFFRIPTDGQKGTAATRLARHPRLGTPFRCV